MGDEARLEQVICNLVNNACKYTAKRGNITITLTQEGRTRNRKGDATMGLGIPPDMLPLVFEMFTQIDRNLDRAQGGLGIGLSLVRSLMQLHGGEVRAESAGERKGSTFTISLPVAAGEYGGTARDCVGSNNDCIADLCGSWSWTTIATRRTRCRCCSRRAVTKR